MKQKKTYLLLQRMTDFTIPQKHRQKVREWLVSKNETEEKDQALIRIWNDTSIDKDITTEEALEKTWNKIIVSGQGVSRRLFINKVIRIVAILLLPLISGITVWMISDQEPKIPQILECYVPNGEQKDILLPDGSRIRLNSGSLLVYPAKFASDKREVFLSGEANFMVEKDVKKPFIVNAGVLDIEVLGTTFNIESYPGSGFIITTLEEGSVKVSKDANSSEAITIIPGEQLIYLINEGRFVKNKVDAADYSAWTKGELRFINRSLDEILFTLERKYDVRFLIDTEIKGSDLFTMKFKPHETVEDALYVLGEIMGTITYKREDQTIRLELKSKEVTR